MTRPIDADTDKGNNTRRHNAIRDYAHTVYNMGVSESTYGHGANLEPSVGVENDGITRRADLRVYGYAPTKTSATPLWIALPLQSTSSRTSTTSRKRDRMHTTKEANLA